MMHFNVAGGFIAGGWDLDQRVRNFDIEEASLSTVTAMFAWDEVADGGHSWWLYQNREPVLRLDPGEVFESDPLPEGLYELIVEPVRWSEPGPPALTGNVDGSRPWLQWTASTDTDVVSYRIYGDGGTGTVDTETPVATVTALRTERLTAAAPTSGTGSGRLSVMGSYAGSSVNSDWSVTVEAGGASYTFATHEGASGESRPIVPGLVSSLPNGVSIRFEDAVADYDASDSWSFHVGPRASWIGAPVSSAGTYKYQVAAVDAAGNEGTLSDEVEVALSPVPEPPTGIAASWDSGDVEVTVSWTASATAGVTYNIYSNWNTIYGDREEYVIETEPHATTSSTSETFSFSSAPGELLFYVRAEKDGVEEQNADLVSVSATASAEAALLAPVVTSVVPSAGGKLTMSWKFGRADGDPAGWNVYSSTSASWDDASLLENVDFTANGAFVSVHSYETGVLGSETWLGVAAVDGSDNEKRSLLVSGVPDGTAPAKVAGVRGMGT